MSKIPAPWAPREPEPHPVKFEVTAIMPDGTRHVMVFDDRMAVAMVENGITRAWPEQCRDRAAEEAAWQAQSKYLQR